MVYNIHRFWLFLLLVFFAWGICIHSGNVLLLAFFAADFFASEICLLLRFSSVIFSAGNFCFWRFFLVFFASCIFSWVNLPYYRIPIGPTFRARARQNIHEINKLFTNVLFFTSKEYPWVKTVQYLNGCRLILLIFKFKYQEIYIKITLILKIVIVILW